MFTEQMRNNDFKDSTAVFRDYACLTSPNMDETSRR